MRCYWGLGDREAGWCYEAVLGICFDFLSFQGFVGFLCCLGKLSDLNILKNLTVLCDLCDLGVGTDLRLKILVHIERV